MTYIFKKQHENTNLSRCGAKNTLRTLQFHQQPRILSLMNINNLINSHNKRITRLIKPHNRRFLIQSTTKASPPTNKIHHSKTTIPRNSQRNLPRRMNSKIINTFLMNRKRLKMNETIGIENRKGAVSVSGDEVTRKREVRWGVEGESGDGGGVVGEGTEGGGG